MAEMLKWATEALQGASMGLTALPLAFLLGLVSAVASACCTLPAMGVLVAYSGTRQDTTRRAAFLSAVWFLVGTVLALVILGFVAGILGRTAQEFLGRYWQLFAGFVAVLFGLAALKLLPFKFPSHAPKDGAEATGSGKMGAVLGGLFLGGGVAACSLPCNPGIFIVIGASVLMGKLAWGMLLMAAFAIGFGLPLTALLCGVSLGKMAIKAAKAEPMIRLAAGALLVGVGFYLLLTF
ncbi:MAG: sulfite exporter TauE/SafE family protein [Magnetococcus sp. WYHC-3]